MNKDFVKVKNIDYKIISTFPILHAGWECDYEGYLVENEGKYNLVFSNHGNFYFAKTKELEEKIKEYREAIRLSNDALLFAYGQKENK